MPRWVRFVARVIFECATGALECAAGALAGLVSAIFFTAFFVAVYNVASSSREAPQYADIPGLAWVFGVVGICVGVTIGFIFWAARSVRDAVAAWRARE